MNQIEITYLCYPCQMRKKYIEHPDGNGIFDIPKKYHFCKGVPILMSVELIEEVLIKKGK